MKRPLSIMIVAGEASGDLHAAKLVRAIRAESGSNVEFFGCAGPLLREAGVEAIVRSDNLSIVGLLEIGRALPTFVRALRVLKRAASERQPDAVVLVDFPDFNLKLAKALKKSGIRVVYYISPQLWAWRKYRLRTIRKYVDLLLTILPFENEWYQKNGVGHVRYVGNPLAMEVHSATDKREFCEKHRMDPTRPLISLLPGSRHKEITRILPVMLAAADTIADANPQVQFAIAAGSASARTDVESVAAIHRTSDGSRFARTFIIQNETYDALNAADAAAVTSGTATLEAAIVGTPMVIVYKTSPINYKLLRPLISVEHFGLINLIAGRRIVNELIQNDFSPETLAAELRRILSPAENAQLRGELRAATDKLGHGGASRRAARAVLELIDR